jgi:hypothetical protein
VFLAKIRDSGSCRELEAESFVAYPPIGVFIISPKFRLKTPSLGQIRRQFSRFSQVIVTLVAG